MKKTLLSFAVVCFLVPLAIAQDSNRPFELMAGDQAPALSVGKWLKGEPVDEFKAGQVYVVELWATWCGPCRKAIPHMTELQEKYGDKVQMVGISIWEKDQANVPKFVKKMGEKMVYSVGMEKIEDEYKGREKGAMARTWMDASGRWLDGIPSAFIVGRDGKIAWVGDPFTIDEPLEKVINKTWDVKAYIAENRDAWDKKAQAAAPYKELRNAFDEEDWDKASNALDRLIGLKSEEFSWAIGKKFKLLAVTMNDAKAASEFGHKAVETYAKDDAKTLNGIAWTIVSPDDNLKDKDLQLALDAANRANELTEHKVPAFIDTLARVYFEKGDRDKAIELQQKAVDMLEGEERDAYQEVLDSYRADNS